MKRILAALWINAPILSALWMAALALALATCLLVLMASLAPAQQPSIKVTQGDTIVLKVAAAGQDLRVSCLPENGGYGLTQLGSDILLVFEPPTKDGKVLEGMYVFALALNSDGKTAVTQRPVQVGTAQGLAPHVGPLNPKPPVDPFANRKAPVAPEPAEKKPAVINPFGSGGKDIEEEGASTVSLPLGSDKPAINSGSKSASAKTAKATPTKGQPKGPPPARPAEDAPLFLWRAEGETEPPAGYRGDGVLRGVWIREKGGER